MSRPTWDETWEEVARLVAQRSLCSRSRVGAVITDAYNRVVSTGYNGPPAGFEHQDLPCTYWCPRAAEHGPKDDRCWAIHAEANAIISGDRSTWQGGTIYVTKHPCWECAKLIANSGLARLVVDCPPELRGHHSYTTYRWLTACGMHVVIVDTTPAPVIHLWPSSEEAPEPDMPCSACGQPHWAHVETEGRCPPDDGV